MSDRSGYERLSRALDFLAVEVESAGLDADALLAARRFYGGSPSEFLGEALIALEHLLTHASLLPTSVAAFADGLAAEIRTGFERVGGG